MADQHKLESILLRRTMGRQKKDINLPDEKAGKPVGKLPFGVKSKDPMKQEYRDRLRRKREPITDDYIQQEEQSRIIFGGDADDPRWDEHNKRVKQGKK